MKNKDVKICAFEWHMSGNATFYHLISDTDITKKNLSHISFCWIFIERPTPLLSSYLTDDLTLNCIKHCLNFFSTSLQSVASIHHLNSNISQRRNILLFGQLWNRSNNSSNPLLHGSVCSQLLILSVNSVTIPLSPLSYKLVATMRFTRAVQAKKVNTARDR